MNPFLSILFFGDIVGQAGRRVVRKLLCSEFCPVADIVVANIENASDDGFGFRQEDVIELSGLGIQAMTGGNHSFHYKSTTSFIGNYPALLRPANFPEETAGRGWCTITVDDTNIAIINLLGRLYMQAAQSPLAVVDDLIEKASREAKIILVDLHATSTGEKAAVAHYLDGRASVVCGTHTHVQTADERILPGGTAFITDVGACAAMHSVIGMDFEAVYDKLLEKKKANMKAADGPARASAVFIEIEKATGRAIRIQRINYEEESASAELRNRQGDQALLYRQPASY